MKYLLLEYSQKILTQHLFLRAPSAEKKKVKQTMIRGDSIWEETEAGHSNGRTHFVVLMQHMYKNLHELHTLQSIIIYLKGGH